MNPEVSGLLDLLLRGKWREAYDLIDAFKTKDAKVIEKELGEALAAFGQPEYQTPLHNLAVELAKGTANWAAIGVAWSVIQGLIFAEFVTDASPALPDDVIRMMASADFKTRKPINEMTAAECATWFADNKAAVRKAAGYAFTQWALRKLPEVRDALTGDANAVAKMKALDPEQVITWLNRAILILTLASAFYPPLLVIVTVLKLILARYESNHPDTGLPLEALAS